MVLTEKETILLNKFQPETIGRNDLLGQLPKGLKIPLLSPSRGENEGFVSFKKCKKVNGSFRCKRLPGGDGFAFEFCLSFFKFTSNELVNSLNTGREDS